LIIVDILNTLLPTAREICGRPSVGGVGFFGGMTFEKTKDPIGTCDVLANSLFEMNFLHFIVYIYAVWERMDA
jgi:hypothetical protein